MNECPECHCLKTGHYAGGCSGTGGNCGCSLYWWDEREQEIRRNHSNCDTQQKPCEVEDLLLTLSNERILSKNLIDKIRASTLRAMASSNSFDHRMAIVAIAKLVKVAK